MAAMLTVAGATAQNNNDKKNLNKEITLEKDFVPVEKKATKKNTLPTVKKVTAPAKTTLSYSDWTEPTTVPTSIPTMLPYGYRTGHNFSDKRGYLKVGGGMAANFMGSAGYRILDTEQNTLGLWLQHNSTWAGKNGSKLILDEAERLKQKFNDNMLGLDFENNNTSGTLTLGVRGHFDSFNYYGGRDHTWDDANKQTFTEMGVLAGWEGKPLTVADRELGYHLGLTFNHAGYDKAIIEGVKGAKENVLNFNVGATYQVGTGNVGLDLTGDLVDLSSDVYVGSSGYNHFMFTVSPYYKWENDVFRALVGADIALGDIHLFDDSKKFHISPRVQLDIDIVDGATIFVDVSGGKTLNTLSAMAAQNRYSDPSRQYYNTYSPLDGRAGFKIGPFNGFSAQLYGGYGIFKSDISAVLFANDYRSSTYLNYKSRGAYLGAELAYKYRSLVEAKATIQYTPVDDDVYLDKWYKGYSLDGTDGANCNATFDIIVNPIRRLSIEAGLHYRGGRSYLTPVLDNNTYELGHYAFQDLDNMVNLHAGARYRINKALTLWLQGNNLLNRKYDFMVGMGAQRLNIMGGASLVF